MTDTPVHDWVLPRLHQLLSDAESAGLDKAVVVAVLTDMVTGPAFNPTTPATDITS